LAGRSTWSGAIHFALLDAHISLTKATEKYRGRESLKEVCACHHKPFVRKTVCVEGFTRRTQATESADEADAMTDAVKGVPDGDGGYAEVNGEVLTAIEAAGTSHSLTVAAILAPWQVPHERTREMFYITPNKNVPGSKRNVDLLYDVLARGEKVAVTKWAPSGREMLLVIRPVENRLVASVLRFEAEVRDPAPFELVERETSPEEIELATQLLDTLPTKFDFVGARDESVEVRQQAIEAARKGEKVPTRPAPSVAEPEQDLMATLRAALAASAPAAADTGELAGAVN
jgi:Ku protein